MHPVIRYLTHPQVAIDPNSAIESWSLNQLGLARVNALANSGALAGTCRVISSAETKAVETAHPIARSLGLQTEIRPRMHENDRSATGFLPAEEFETVADRFFSRPGDSVRGWETAMAAQARILSEISDILLSPPGGDILIVGHGAVGTLLYCALSDLTIDRRHDQPNGGGCYFAFSYPEQTPLHPWRPMEELSGTRPTV